MPNSVEGRLCGHPDLLKAPPVVDYCRQVPASLFRAFVTSRVVLRCTACNDCAGRGTYDGVHFAELVLSSMRRRAPPPPLDCLPTSIVAACVRRWPLWLGAAAADVVSQRSSPLPPPVAHTLVCSGVATRVSLASGTPSDAGRVRSVLHWQRWLAGARLHPSHRCLIEGALRASTPLPDDMIAHIVRVYC